MATTGMSIGIRQAVDKLGFETGARLYDAYTEAIDVVEQLVTEERIDCEFARTGKLNPATKPAHYEAFQKTAELLNTRHRAGRQLHHRHRTARRERVRRPASDTADGLGLQEPPQLLPDHARQPPALRRPSTVRGVQPTVAREERQAPARGHGSHVPPACRLGHRLLLGRSGRHDPRPDGQGRQHDGVYYSMGYAGHGVQMASYMGRQMAEYMSGYPEANTWRDFEFRRIPGRFGPPWFLPFAGAYYKFKDRVG
jgi:hypothetical protein